MRKQFTLRIKAFTIIELVITLLISSVVMGIVYYCLLVVNKQFLRYQTKTSNMEEGLLLQKAIFSDFNRADLIQDSLPNSLILYGKRDEMVYYHFEENYTVRQINQLSSDTFKVKRKEFKSTYLNDTIPVIDGIGLAISIEGAEYFIQCNKIYSAAQLLKFQN